MALETGTRIGVYEVTGKLGEGGMGEVYRAHDTTLDRDVALKVLSEAFTAEPDRLARFQREAKVLASLNHPNIGGIYGLEPVGDSEALVLELIEGPTLADRIAKGPMPVEEALSIARQIADALEVAHEQGIVHRDLKPANVKVKSDGTVKVLDFGLAKAVNAEPGGSAAGESPTISLTGATQMGLVIGTAAYMPPEQARGKPVDKRADIWAFAVVLFEMLTGKRAFMGEDTSLTLAAVMTADPDLAALPAAVPPSVVKSLERCLQKDPQKRLRDIGDVQQAMEGVFETVINTPTANTTQRTLKAWQQPWVITAGLLAALVVGGSIIGFSFGWSADSGSVTVSRLTIPAPGAAVSQPQQPLALSPDGEIVVYAATEEGSGIPQLYQRRLDQFDAMPMRGTAPASSPIFSPDGEWVAYFGQGEGVLKKVALAGGPPVNLTPVNSYFWGDWGTNGTIVFSGMIDGVNGLWQVSDAGGEARELLAATEGEVLIDPFFTPNEQGILFTQVDPSVGNTLSVLSLDSGERRVLLEGSSGRVLPTGHLLFTRADSMWGVPFDEGNLQVMGDPAPLFEGLQVTGYDTGRFAVADNGSLIYLSGGETFQVERTLVWVDRDGIEEPLAALPRAYLYPRMSPDGSRVALEVFNPGDVDIWVWEFMRETLTRLTLDTAPDEYPLWTPDGRQMIFTSPRVSGIREPHRRPADGTGAAERLTESNDHVYPQTITPDGKTLVLRQGIDSQNLVTLSLEGDRGIQPLLDDPSFHERNAEFSQNGNWMAYETNESGQFEIYVRPFPDVEAGRWQISTDGGSMALWSKDGNELFYRSLDGTIVSVPVNTGETFSAGNASVVVNTPYFTGAGVLVGRAYDVSPDGQRFLMIREDLSVEASNTAINIVLNWTEELQARVPIP